MAIEAATGVLALSTGAIGTTFTVSGLAFQPKALIVWWGGRDSATDAIGAVSANNARQGFGLATGTSARFCAGYSFERQTVRNDALVATVSNITVNDGLVDVDSINSDGFTGIVDDALPAALRLSWLALGGSSLTNVKVSTFDSITGTGDQDVTGVGFQPDAAFFLNAFPTSIPGAIWESFMHFGFAAGATPDNIVWAGSNVAKAYCRSGESIATCDFGGDIIGRASITAWQSDGFRVNWVENPGVVRPIIYLALKGGSYKVGSFNTRTDGNDIVVTPNITSKAVFLLSAGRTESTTNVATNYNKVSAGAFTSTSSRNAQGVLNDNVDSQNAIEYDAAYVNIDTTPAILGLGDVTAMDSSTFTIVMDDHDDAANFVGYFAIGDPASHTVAVGQASETDTAQSITVVKVKALSQALETDLAQTLAWAPKHRLVTQANELDLAQGMTAGSAVTLGQAFELDLAFPLVGDAKTELLRQALEIDTAGVIYATIDPLPDRPVFLDSAIVREVVGPLTEITGLDHLNGLSVCVVLDGRIHDTSYVVNSGAITLNTPVLQKIEVGICYDGELWTMRPGLKDNQIEGLPRSWATLGLLVKQSYGGLVRLGASTAETPIYEGDRSYNPQPAGGYTRLFTGDVNLTPYGESELDGRVKIRVPTPAPFTVLALYGDLEVGGHA